MSEKKRFEFYYDDYLVGIIDTVTGKKLNHFATIDLLNEQDEKIDEMAETNEILNEYIRIGDELDKEKLEVLKDVETEIKLLNSYLVERGLAEDYIRWTKSMGV